MRTPLDIIYAGWKIKYYERLIACEWVQQQAEGLELMKDMAVEKEVVESRKRKEY